MGVNSAFEDVLALDNALNRTNDDVGKALQMFSKQRAPQAKALVKISRQLDGGTLSFLVPLILDSIFNKIAPLIFSGMVIVELTIDLMTGLYISDESYIDSLLLIKMPLI